MPIASSPLSSIPAILGVESVVFGVADLAEHTRFWADFGLPLESTGEHESVFRLQSGSRVIVVRHGDPRLPVPDPFAGDGIKETVWGVDTPENLERIAASLATEVAVTRDADGTVHCVCPDGQPIALRVWAKRAVVSEASPVNTPSSWPRFNQHRIWRKRAIYDGGGWQHDTRRLLLARLCRQLRILRTPPWLPLCRSFQGHRHLCPRRRHVRAPLDLLGQLRPADRARPFQVHAHRLWLR